MHRNGKADSDKLQLKKLITSSVNYFQAPNKRGVPISRGGWKILQNEISGEKG